MLSTFDVLVFSRTTGFRHGSIAAGIAAIESLGAANDFTVTATENQNLFTDANLEQYEAVVFLNTTGNPLGGTQQAVFERYIQSGGGYLGVHAAADAEYNWSWYGDLMGAYFQSHPSIQQATINVADKAHPATRNLPDRWSRTDEWYNYQVNPRGDVHVLMTLDESTYSGGSDGFDHPIAWCHEYDGGRSFYTGLGHTSSTYSEPLFLDHLLGGIQYAAGQTQGDCGATIESNFDVTVLEDATTNPMELEVLPNGDVLYIERSGAIRIHDQTANRTRTAGVVQVTQQQEDGLLGLAVDPEFEQNNWIYLFYSPPGFPSRQQVSRFSLIDGQIDNSSEHVLLEIPVQRTSCCHSAGSMTFGPDGSLFISTGDNTNPFESQGYAPIDERPGRSNWDAQKSSANVDDLRGKVLRIMPQSDGTYTIPDGNLFPADGSGGRPEIYVMGTRNSFRISVDQQTGWLYWGDVGPDAGGSNALRGPAGHDEINQAQQAGNFGWPLFVGDNKPYREYDFATGQSGDFYDPAAPVNNSPNNTGTQQLPPAQPALIWYPYGGSTEFPQVGTGGRTAMAGPVYQYESGLASSAKLPDYYDDTLFIYEWSRNWVKEVKLDDSGEILAINDFMPGLELNRPMDMEVGPDGAIYMIEWGSGFGGNNSDSQIIKIEYQGAVEIPGDLNGDGTLDCVDANTLSTAIADGETNGVYDMNGDGIVDSNDMSFWITDMFGTLLGDANLNRDVDVGDFNVWNANKFTSTADYCSGDFNADGNVDVSDFNLWNANKFQSAAIAINGDSPTEATAEEPTLVEAVSTDGVVDFRVEVIPWANGDQSFSNWLADRDDLPRRHRDTAVFDRVFASQLDTFDDWEYLRV